MRVFIIGQGIAGTWLSYWFMKAGADVVVIDNLQTNASTRVASGVINPVTGRQVVTTWMADELLPFSEKVYTDIGNLVGRNLIRNCGILAFPASEQMMGAYRKKISDGSPYVHPVNQPADYEGLFRYSAGAVCIKPAYWIDLQTLIASWRQWLLLKDCFLEDNFEPQYLEINQEGVHYKSIQADYVFYCQGIQIARSDFWSGLPFSFNKGEALVADIPGLPAGQIYKFGISTLVPWYNGKWWIGSTYDNRFTDDKPTPAFRQKTEIFLQQTLTLPFSVEDHIAAIRPATLERRPFAGLHPQHPRVGILGGLGTKGVSLSPWLSHQLVNRVLTGTPLQPAADVARFQHAFLPFRQNISRMP